MKVGSMILYARDVAATVAFYRELGIDFLSSASGRYSADVDGVWIAVVEAAPDEAPTRTGSVGGVMPGFEVASVAEAVAAAGVFGTVVREPESHGWGVRALVADPDGRVVEIVEKPAA